MPNTTLTRENLTKRIRRRLGEGIVAVELQDENLEEAIETALDHYNQVRPKRMHSSLAITRTQRAYDLEAIGGFDDIIGVVHVDFITRRDDVDAAPDPFDPYDTVVAGMDLGSGAGETFGDIAQRLAYTQDAMRVIDGEAEWEFVWSDDDRPVLYLVLRRDYTLASVEWRQRYPFTDAGMQKIPQGDVKWFMDYSTAQAKLMLGRSLRKFQGVTNPEGGQDPMDGVELVSEATEDIRALEEQLERRRPPLPPVIE